MAKSIFVPDAKPGDPDVLRPFTTRAEGPAPFYARMLAGLAVALFAGVPVGWSQVQQRLDSSVPDLERGGDLYARACAQCHEKGVDRAPPRAVLSAMSPDVIHRALVDGPMAAMAAGMSDAEKRGIAQFLAGRPGAPPSAAGGNCAAGAVSSFDYNQPPDLEGWGLSPGNTHEIPTRVAGMGRATAPRLKLKWAFAFPQATRARSQPAFAGGALFVGSQDGTVYALDRDTGCIRWRFKARAEVRTGIVVTPWKKGDRAARPPLYFGDTAGNVYAVDAITGAQLWTDKADPHPSVILTGTATLHDGRLYVPVSSLESAAARNVTYACCTFRGSVIAYDARTGARLWQTSTIDEPAREVGVNNAGGKRFAPSGAAIWSTPTIDVKRSQILVTTGNNYSAPATATSDALIALDLRTGRKKWSTQTMADAWNGSCFTRERANCPNPQGLDYDLGTGAMLARGANGRDYVLAGSKSGVVYAFSPDNGRILWRAQVGRGGVFGGVHMGMAAQGGAVLVPIGDPEVDPDYAKYTEPGRPGIYALDIASGRPLWAAPAPDICKDRSGCLPGYSAVISATPELVLAGSTDGFMRVLDRRSGRLLWEYDTFQEVPAVNGGVAKGGSIDGTSAPVAHGGLLAVMSGYVAGALKRPGNALLVFEAD